jgi:hypothetical protein
MSESDHFHAEVVIRGASPLAPTSTKSLRFPLEVVEDKVGTGSVDFWGISFSPSSTEQGPMEEAELERGITILQACWAFFDAVAARVSPEMRKGPWGGEVATATASSATRSASRARTSRNRSGCGSRRRRR